MIRIKNSEQIKVLKDGGKILASVLQQAMDTVAPGVSTIELDSLVEKLIRNSGGEPSFKNYKTLDDRFPYPASLCVSVNDEVVHGIPGERILREGDIVGLDLGMKYKNLFTDMAVTVSVGQINSQAEKLIETTRRALYAGIDIVKPGARIGDIGFAIQSVIRKNNFGVVRNLVGHGVGFAAHEDPEIPNFGRKNTGLILREGMVFAIEPMATIGSAETFLAEDEWTWKTKDGSLSAHFEHTVAVVKDGVEILTNFDKGV